MNFQATAKTVEKFNEQPIDVTRIEPGPCPEDRKALIEKKYWESYDRHCMKQLEPEELKRLQDDIDE